MFALPLDKLARELEGIEPRGSYIPFSLTIGKDNICTVNGSIQATCFFNCHFKIKRGRIVF